MSDRPRRSTTVPAGAYTELGGSGARPPLQRRMHHYFEATADRLPDQTALQWEGSRATYAQLDRAANQLAHYLLTRHDVLGKRVGLLVARSREMYVALLAIQKAGAAWVPIDPSSPADPVEYFASDSEMALFVTTSDFDEVTAGLTCPRLHVDAVAAADLAALSENRPDVDVAGDPTAYVIYTSGSTGRPKGVDIAQSSICNFIHIITELYDVRASDRVYQGMTISFDFAIEEVWPTWAAGAALVAGPTDGRRVGAGLTTFLEEHAITLLYIVPTVLSTLERTVASVRGVMVGGEACPAELVERWSPGRRMLNTYGPTEATVTCTVGVLEPGRPVTIGIPVPSYTAYILDEERRPVPRGDDGELCIGGVGVARGYLNRPDLTVDRFIAAPHDPRERIYRTGDLARIDDRGEIVYLGRADAEVKIRGHRVDLGEVESVLMRADGVHTAAVKHLNSANPGDELAGYLVPQPGVSRSGERLTALHERLREVLPPYMVPTFLEWVDELPMLPSGKVDRKQLPDPSSPRLVGGSGAIEPPRTDTERWVRDVWAEVFGIDPGQLSVGAHFFADLGGHSLVAATVTSRMRRDDRGASLAVMDLYTQPTVRRLADHLDMRAMSAAAAAATDEPQVAAAPRQSVRYAGWRVALFGLAQLLVIYLVVAFRDAAVRGDLRPPRGHPLDGDAAGDRARLPAGLPGRAVAVAPGGRPDVRGRAARRRASALRLDTPAGVGDPQGDDTLAHGQPRRVGLRTGLPSPGRCPDRRGLPHQHRARVAAVHDRAGGRRDRRLRHPPARRRDHAGTARHRSCPPRRLRHRRCQLRAHRALRAGRRRRAA